MAAKANESNLLSSYRMADPEGRLEIMFANYHVFPKMIRKMEKKTKYKIKAEKEYVRSHNRGELGVRVQTSNLSDITADEAIDNVMLEDALKTGDIAAGLLKGIDNASEYEADIRTISIMKDDYELVEECIEDMDEQDSLLMKGYFLERKIYKEMACEFNMSYDSVKRRIRFLKEYIKEDIIDCLELNCRR